MDRLPLDEEIGETPEADIIQASPEDFNLLLESPAWQEIVIQLRSVQLDVYQKLLAVTDPQQLGLLQGEGTSAAYMLGLPTLLSEQAEIQLDGNPNE